LIGFNEITYIKFFSFSLSLRIRPQTHPALDGLVILVVFSLMMKDDLHFVVAKATNVRAWKLNPKV
jgi:hypothetical protein